MEIYYCSQDGEKALVLFVDFEKHTVDKYVDCPVVFCENCRDMQWMSVDAVSVFLKGLNRSFFVIKEYTPNSNDTEEKEAEKRKFYFLGELSRRQEMYKDIIEQEYEVYDELNKNRAIYEEINDKHLELLGKCDHDVLVNYLKEHNVNEDTPGFFRTAAICDTLKNSDKNGFAAVKEQMKNDSNWNKANEISKKLQPAFLEIIKSFSKVGEHSKKEYELFTDKYKKKLDEYANKGLFLYCLNTPDLPIDDDKITIDDVYNHFIDDEAMYLSSMFEVFADFGEFGEINKREADDLVASFHLLLDGKYWAALRNLYALIDHHHKLCSSIFNGYIEKEKTFKNGKQRSDYIGKLFNDSNIERYIELWKKLDAAIEEINKGSGDRFVSRNSIVHGDYEIAEVNPQAKDVINIFMLYITLRRLVDYMANVEFIIKEINIYTLSYLVKNSN